MVGHGSLTSAEGREVSTNISQSNAMLITPLQTQVFGIMPEPMIKPPNQARKYQHLSCVFSHDSDHLFFGQGPLSLGGWGEGGGAGFNTQEKRPQ